MRRKLGHWIQWIWILVFWTGGAFAQETGMAFLKIGVDARAMAMGNAYTAAATGASALYWNPAGLLSNRSLGVLVHHNQWLFGSSSEFVGIAAGGQQSAWGAFVHTFFIDGIEVRQVASVEPLAETNALFMAVGGTYAQRFSERLVIGGTVKYLFQKIYVEQAGGWALDVGARYRWREQWYLALTVQNVGKMAVLNAEATPLPTALRVGVAWSLFPAQANWALQLTGDVVKFRGQDVGLALGSEITLWQQLAFRGGMVMGIADRSWSLGVGVEKTRFRFHYALVPFSANLGVTHQLTFEILLD